MKIQTKPMLPSQLTPLISLDVQTVVGAWGLGRSQTSNLDWSISGLSEVGRNVLRLSKRTLMQLKLGVTKRAEK